MNPDITSLMISDRDAKCKPILCIACERGRNDVIQDFPTLDAQGVYTLMVR
jgi:hypothetical protein